MEACPRVSSARTTCPDPTFYVSASNDQGPLRAHGRSVLEVRGVVERANSQLPAVPRPVIDPNDDGLPLPPLRAGARAKRPSVPQPSILIQTADFFSSTV